MDVDSNASEDVPTWFLVGTIGSVCLRLKWTRVACGGWVKAKRRLCGPVGSGQAEKVRIVRETLEPGVSVPVLARGHSVNANQLFIWRMHGGPVPRWRAGQGVGSC